MEDPLKLTFLPQELEVLEVLEDLEDVEDSVEEVSEEAEEEEITPIWLPEKETSPSLSVNKRDSDYKSQS